MDAEFLIELKERERQTERVDDGKVWGFGSAFYIRL